MLMRSDGEIRKSLYEQQACFLQAPPFQAPLLIRSYQIQYTIQQSPHRQNPWRKTSIPAHQEEGQPAKVR